MTKKECEELSYKIIDAWVKWLKPGNGTLYVRYEQEPKKKEALMTFSTRNRVDPNTYVGMTKIGAIYALDKLVHTYDPDLWY